MKAKPPTKAQRKRWEALRAHGCMVCGAWAAEIHHLFTGGGGRKDHDKVAPLCNRHHNGDEHKEGLHQISRRVFAKRFMSEQEMHDKCVQLVPID